MTRILVTGANGAIGTALVERLAATEYDVVGVDVAEHELDVDHPVHVRDLRSDDPLPDVDVVVHLAAHSRVQPMIDRPELVAENVEMTRRALEHAVQQDAAVLLASSREVYGSAIRPDEGAAGIEVSNPYGASKVATESLASAFASSFDLDVTTLRLANVYGAHDLNPRVVPIFVTKSLRGEQLVVYGADKLLDFVHVSDVVAAFERAIDRRADLAGDAINVGSGVGTKLTELAGAIVDRVDDSPGWVVEPNRTGDTEQFVADVEKARAVLDHDPLPLDRGLDRTVEWYREHDAAREAVRRKLN